MPAGKKIAVIGLGNLGGTLVRGLLEAKVAPPARMVAADARTEAGYRCGIRFTMDNAEAARGAGVVILSVKPKVMGEVLRSIRPVVGKGRLVISTAAGVSTALLEGGLAAGVPVVRVMPNTPCRVRSGMTAICAGKNAKRRHIETARKIFGALGRVIVLDEKLLDAVTGLSGSGPAFLYEVIDALAEGGVAAGLSREAAVELAAQTALGAAKMVLETGESPAKLRDAVATPGGCTVEGLKEIEAGGVRETLRKAVLRAAKRASELANG